jgi:hypothetical protein
VGLGSSSSEAGARIPAPPLACGGQGTVPASPSPISTDPAAVARGKARSGGGEAGSGLATSSPSPSGVDPMARRVGRLDLAVAPSLLPPQTARIQIRLDSGGRAPAADPASDYDDGAWMGLAGHEWACWACPRVFFFIIFYLPRWDLNRLGKE